MPSLSVVALVRPYFYVMCGVATIAAPCSLSALYAVR